MAEICLEAYKDNDLMINNAQCYRFLELKAIQIWYPVHENVTLSYSVVYAQSFRFLWALQSHADIKILFLQTVVRSWMREEFKKQKPVDWNYKAFKRLKNNVRTKL
jgi:hypothetical protein